MARKPQRATKKCNKIIIALSPSLQVLLFFIASSQKTPLSCNSVSLCNRSPTRCPRTGYFIYFIPNRPARPPKKVEFENKSKPVPLFSVLFLVKSQNTTEYFYLQGTPRSSALANISVDRHILRIWPFPIIPKKWPCDATIRSNRLCWIKLIFNRTAHWL